MLEKKLTIEVTFLIIVLLAIFIRWFTVFDEEASAPPIVIDKTAPKEVKSRNLIKSSGKNANSTNYIPNSNINYNVPGVLGGTGYNLADLGQPCVNDTEKKTGPNLPSDYQNQICDPERDLICTRGIYEGNICLKKINGSCKFSQDCSPEASKCINNICQQPGEVINKICSIDEDCQGNQLQKFNHICDPDTKRCVYNIWPKDSGCTNKKQCLYGNTDPDSVSCITSSAEDFIIEKSGEYVKEDNKFIFDEDFNLARDNNLSGSYVELKNLDNNIQKRLRIEESSITNLIFTKNNFTIESGSNYQIIFGSQDAGICVINYPLGTKPTTIDGSEQNYPCKEGLELLQGYCAEPKRKKGNNGVSGQICIYKNSILGCENGLDCTYDPGLTQSYFNGIGNVYVKDDLINGEKVKNIGFCKQQIKNRLEPCQNNCDKQYVCLQESNINNISFSYCGYEWEVLKNRSQLNDCPIGPDVFQLDNNDVCKYVNKNFCLKNEECLSGKCSGSYKMSYYNPIQNSYSSSENISSPGPNLNLIMCKDYEGEGDSSSIIGYYVEVGSSWNVYFKLEGGSNYEKYYTIGFEDQLSSGPCFSVFKKEDNSYQFNIEYVLEYENNRKREFVYDSDQNFNFYNSGLTEGMSVYFKGKNEVYSISFDSGYVTQGPDSLIINKVKDSSGGSISKPVNGTMVTYDSRYYVTNVTGSTNRHLIYTNSPGTGLNSQDKVTYYQESSSGACYLTNTPGNYLEFSNGTSYYTYMFNSPGDTQNVNKYIFLSEDYEYINFNPLLDGTSYNNLEIVKYGSDFLETNSYLKLEKAYGFNFLPLNITSTTPTNQIINIKSRSDYVYGKSPAPTNPGISHFNMPVGYFSDTDNIVSEITENNILLTYIYSDNTNQTLNLSYDLEINPLLINNTIQYNNIDSNISYSIENSFSQPSLKVSSGVSYSKDQAPYELDKVRYFNNSSDTNTINFLSTYKDIEPDNNRASIGYISNLRKTSFDVEFNPGEDPNIIMEYQGVENTTNNFFNDEIINFGNTYYYELSDIVESLSESTEGVNIYIGGSNEIIFNNQNDIDAVLKYGSVDLVIGFGENFCDNAIAITRVLDYDIDEVGIQTLIVKTSNLIPFNENFINPKLYINNIFPMKIEEENSITYVTDGRVLYSSTVPAAESSGYLIENTSYNKIINKAPSVINGSTSYSSFFNFYFLKPGTEVSVDNLSVFFRNNDSRETVISQFNSSENNFRMNISYSKGNRVKGNLSQPRITFILNDKFFSSTLLNLSNIKYLNNIQTSNNFSVLGKYTKNGIEENKTNGRISFKLNTRPFFTGIPGNQGLLDETYLTDLTWPYWINNINLGTLKINKIFLNWNPGNMENDMFYYALSELNGTKVLLYLSINFVNFRIKESQPVPIILDLGEDINDNFYMIPYNKNLAILSKQCISV